VLYHPSKFHLIRRSHSRDIHQSSIMSTVPLLTANYSLWSDAMEDYLRSKGYWFQIHTAPPTVATDPKGWRHCMEARDSAVGEIRRHLSPELRSVALGSSDPLLILNAIKAAYGTSSFATCHKANAAQENQTPSESAGAASIRLSSSPSALPNTWNADTGATAHMTPRREWFKSYTPCSVPIRVANGQVVYAAGRGTVEFAPVKDSRKLRPVLFSDVLHVPALNQNLLSVLTLTSKHAFRVVIESNTMEFIKDTLPRFYASVGADRVALLSGRTVVHSGLSASSAQTGYELWHRRFGHISPARLKSLVELEMVTNLSLPSVPSSAPICTSCMDGKQT